MWSSLVITSRGSLGDDGKGSQSSASAATTASDGATLRSETSRTYLWALSAARFRASPCSDRPSGPVSFAIQLFLSAPPAKTPASFCFSLHKTAYDIQFLME